MVAIKSEKDTFAGVIACQCVWNEDFTKPFYSSFIVRPPIVCDLDPKMVLVSEIKKIIKLKTYPPTPSTVHHSGGLVFATTNVGGIAWPSALTTSKSDTSSKLSDRAT